jgi:hypothetical protein
LRRCSLQRLSVVPDFLLLAGTRARNPARARAAESGTVAGCIAATPGERRSPGETIENTGTSEPVPLARALLLAAAGGRS